MSCLPPLTRAETSDSSDYGSDFTPDEEELLNELLCKAVAEHATATTPTSTAAVPIIEHADTIAATADLESLQPAVTDALVADIEDGLEEPSGSVRLPKVLGREKPRSPWRQASRRSPFGPGVQAGAGVWCASPGAGNRSSPSGMRCSIFPWRIWYWGSFTQGVESADTLLSKRLVEHPRSTEGRERERERGLELEREWTQEDQATATLDPRSPMERFRRPPNKAFSVTDLVSPAWCELQYWYTLTKHGRKRRTPAMKKGSVVHKTLEDEIYTTVPVEITTKEDAWALRIWNVIQGLRMLREYGVTRELEIWGVVDGELVNGVIDQLSYECPDPELEATASSFYADAVQSRNALPEYQMSLSDFLLSSSQGGRRLSDLAQPETVEKIPPSQEPPPAFYSLPRVYMTDVKTKAKGGSVPTAKSTSFRPTLLQLQLYYHMLNRLITSDDVTMELLAARYDFDPDRPFTDAFISEVGGLNDEFFDALSSQEFDLDNNIPTPEDAQRISPGTGTASSPPKASQDSTGILQTHGNLSRLWGYMKEQLRSTFLPPASSNTHPVAPSIPSDTQPTMLEPYPTLLSPVLTARFLSSAPTTDLQPRLLGSRSFLFDPTSIDTYLTDQMEWWRGARDPRGVNIVEAWKCRVCEFRDECSWRQEREWDLARRNRGRRNRASADM